jgi:hypothetical protein
MSARRGARLSRRMRDDGAVLCIAGTSWLAVTRGPIRRAFRGEPGCASFVAKGGIATALAVTIASTVLVFG